VRTVRSTACEGLAHIGAVSGDAWAELGMSRYRALEVPGAALGYGVVGERVLDAPVSCVDGVERSLRTKRSGAV
jgi:hypothetical protein